MGVVHERISTEDDGPNTVNERLSDGGPGPEGQPRTVTERLSTPENLAGDAADPVADAEESEATDEKPAKKTAKKTAAKK